MRHITARGPLAARTENVIENRGADRYCGPSIDEEALHATAECTMLLMRSKRE
jgi:hypothetical protein